MRSPKQRDDSMRLDGIPGITFFKASVRRLIGPLNGVLAATAEWGNFHMPGLLLPGIVHFATWRQNPKAFPRWPDDEEDIKL